MVAPGAAAVAVSEADGVGRLAPEGTQTPHAMPTLEPILSIRNSYDIVGKNLEKRNAAITEQQEVLTGSL